MSTLDQLAAEARFKKFIDDGIKARPIEATLVRKVVRSLYAAGNPVAKIDDREDVVELKTTGLRSQTREVLEAAFNLDELFLICRDGGWVRLTMGEGYESLTDYTLNLEGALKDVNAWVDRGIQ